MSFVKYVEGDDRTVVHFTEATLTSVSDASYVELSKPEINGSLACSYCEKTTSHEHEFSGRIKFLPAEEKYTISLVLPKRDRKRKRESSLQIIPIKELRTATSAPKVRTRTSKNVNDRLFPLAVLTEREAMALFRDALRVYTTGGGGNEVVVKAVKVLSSGLIYLLRGQKVTGAKMGLLNTSQGAVSERCKLCNDLAFETTTDFLQHFSYRHQVSVRLKKIREAAVKTVKPTSEAEATRNDQDVDDNPEAAEIVSDNDGLFRCDLCNATFDTEELRISHKNDTHASKRAELKFQCEVCLQKFHKKAAYVQHKSNHGVVKERPYVCHLCRKRFLKPQHLEAHVKIHVGAKSYACDLCDKRYTSVHMLKSHKVNVHNIGEKPKCGECGKSFYSQSLVNKHVLEQHERDPRLCCDYCGAFYLRRDNLEEHVRTAHEDDSLRLSCKVCKATAGNALALEDHMRSHHGVLPWNKLVDGDMERELLGAGRLQCKVCEKSFLPSEMETHLRFSHGVLPVKPGSLNAADFAAFALPASASAEALLRTLTPQPDYLLRCLTPLPMETLDDFIGQ